MAADHNDSEVAVLTERVSTLIRQVEQLLPLAQTQAVHTEQIAALRKFVCDVNTRQWWLIGLMITVLIGVAVKVCAG